MGVAPMARVTFNAKLAFVNKSILPPEQNIAEGTIAPASYTRHQSQRICVATPHTHYVFGLFDSYRSSASVMRHNSCQLCIGAKCE